MALQRFTAVHNQTHNIYMPNSFEIIHLILKLIDLSKITDSDIQFKHIIFSLGMQYIKNI